MKPGIKILLSKQWLVLFLIILSSCHRKQDFDQNEHSFDLQTAQWIIGSWEAADSTGKSVESWQQVNDTLFEGRSVWIQLGDTTVIEQLTLAQTGDSIFYTALVMGQNEGKPIRFRLIELTDSTMLFENRTHDFPNSIRYSIQTSDSLIAIVSGLQQGKETAIRIGMRRSL